MKGLAQRSIHASDRGKGSDSDSDEDDKRERVYKDHEYAGGGDINIPGDFMDIMKKQITTMLDSINNEPQDSLKAPQDSLKAIIKEELKRHQTQETGNEVAQDYNHSEFLETSLWKVALYHCRDHTAVHSNSTIILSCS